jgi:hypothetical protein
VQSLDEDRIIRHFVNVVQAAVRTNFYQLGPDGRVRDEIAVKLDAIGDQVQANWDAFKKDVDDRFDKLEKEARNALRS